MDGHQLVVGDLLGLFVKNKLGHKFLFIIEFIDSAKQLNRPCCVDVIGRELVNPIVLQVHDTNGATFCHKIIIATDKFILFLEEFYRLFGG